MKKPFSILVTFLAVIVLSTCPAFAQTCADTVEDTFENCLDAAVTSCATTSGFCTEDDAERITIADAASDKVTNDCCNRGNKGTKLACFVRAIAAARASRRLFNSAVVDEILAEFREFKDAVRDTGQCPSE